jgi:dUTP pyrophosphatase
MDKVIVKVKKLRPEAKLPVRATPGSAAADLFACFTDKHKPVVKVGPGRTVIVPTGISVEVPEGYEMQIRPRSGLAVKGIVVANAPGTIDSDYRGEVAVILYNNLPSISGTDNDVYSLEVRTGDRIAQVLVKPVPPVEYVEVEELSGTLRGQGGFGSTGR